MPNKNLTKVTNLANALDSIDLNDFHQSKNNNIFYEHFTHYHKKEILKNILLYSDENIVHKSINSWSIELLIALQQITIQPNKQQYAAKIADIFNVAAQIFLFVDDAKSARELCYSQIQLFMTWGHRSGNRELLKYVFQPWINLSRIDRLEGYFHEANNKLNALMTTSERVMHLNKPLNRLLHDLIYSNDEIKHSIETYSLLEPVKAYLRTKRYGELIHFIGSKLSDVENVQQPILQESLAIAFANTGKIRGALALLTHAKSQADPSIQPIFRLRECEMRLLLDNNDDAVNELLALATLSLELLNRHQINIHHIFFGIHTAYLMKMSGLNQDAAKLCYFCLEAAENINDEILKAECLIMLYDMELESEGKKLIENLMIEHYFNTQYAVARKRMLNTFKDLKHVESKHNHDRVTSLFEELLIFSSRLLS